jgi:prepilin-type N-terminal cleavage/methylation domain-containing protein
MSKRKGRNSGFTLVELIVVLVILAILAAILVPALLGYIDRAKSQQIVLNARSCLTAAQVEMTEMYAKDVTGMGDAGGGKINYIIHTEAAARILDTADVPDCTLLVFGCDEGLGDKDRAAYKVTFVYYMEGDKGIYFDGQSWIESDTYPSSVANSKYVYYVKMAGWEDM